MRRPLTSRSRLDFDAEGGSNGQQDKAQKAAYPPKHEPEIMPCGRQDGVDGIAGPALEKAAPKMAFGFHVADDGFDG